MSDANKEAKMSNREQNRADNDALQSGEGDLAKGQNEHDFGAGRQTVINTQGDVSSEDRKVDNSAVTSD